MVFTYQDKVDIKGNILKLSEQDWFQVYIILKNNKESFTINENGLLFDLINISNKSLNLIKNYIENLKNN
jgi:hypothetical protein